MKRIITLLLSILLSTILVACTSNPHQISKVTLIDDVSFDSGIPIFLYRYEDGTASERFLSDVLKMEELVNQINEVEAIEVEMPDLEKLEGSLYCIQVPQFNHDYGDRLISGWQDGYWFAENGKIYLADLDFEQILIDFPWENERIGAEAEENWGVNLSYYGGKWYPEFLAAEAKRSGNDLNPWPEPTPSEYIDWKTNEDIQVILEYDTYPVGMEEFYCIIQNNSGELIFFVPEIEVEVFLDDEWKSLSDKHHTPYNLLVRSLESGIEGSETVDLDRSAWDFTPGRYRICVEYCIGDFDIRRGKGFDHVAIAEFEISEDD